MCYLESEIRHFTAQHKKQACFYLPFAFHACISISYNSAIAIGGKKAHS